FRLRLFAGVSAIPIIYFVYQLISSFAPEPPAASWNYVAIVSVVCIAQSVNIIDCYFQSIAIGKLIMYVQVRANLLSALVRLALILTGATLTAFIWILPMDALFMSCEYLYVYRTQHPPPVHGTFDRTIARSLLKRYWPLALSSVFVTL